MSNVSQTSNPPTWLGDPDPAKGPVIGVSQADINDLHFQIANLKVERDAAYAAGQKEAALKYLADEGQLADRIEALRKALEDVTALAIQLGALDLEVEPARAALAGG